MNKHKRNKPRSSPPSNEKPSSVKRPPASASRDKDHTTEAISSRSAVTRNRLAAFILGLAGISGAAYHFSKQEPSFGNNPAITAPSPNALAANRPGTASPPAAPEAGSARIPEPIIETEQTLFDFKTYKPPAEGVVIKKINGGPGANKTILYIADHHASSRTLGPASIRTGLRTQKEIFAIIEDAIAKYRHLPVVLEIWTDFGNDTFNRNIALEMLGDLSRKPTLAERKKEAAAMIGSERIEAGSVLAAVYRDEITPLPAQSREDQMANLEENNRMHFMTDTNKNNISCGTFTALPGYKSVAMAEAGIRSDSGSGFDSACYCAYHELGNRYMDDFFRNREIDAPEKEMKRAAARKEKLVVIIAGTLHARRSLELAKAQKTNLILVSPAGIVDTVKETLKAKSHEPFSLDTAEGTCEKWSRQHSAEIRSLDADIRRQIHEQTLETFREAEKMMDKAK